VHILGSCQSKQRTNPSGVANRPCSFFRAHPFVPSQSVEELHFEKLCSYRPIHNAQIPDGLVTVLLRKNKLSSRFPVLRVEASLLRLPWRSGDFDLNLFRVDSQCLGVGDGEFDLRSGEVE
jgi:hypothetical protein